MTETPRRQHKHITWVAFDVTVRIEEEPTGLYVRVRNKQSGRRGAIKLICNDTRCRGRRLAYCNTLGEVVRLGPVKYDKPLQGAR